jgi:DNA mismatch endonuclease Vsr
MDESWASSARARNVMRGNRSRDTRPELAVRSAVYRLGLRYRVAARPLKHMRRSADLIFVSTRVAVFVDGCFWQDAPSITFHRFRTKSIGPIKFPEIERETPTPIGGCWRRGGYLSVYGRTRILNELPS